MQYKPRKGDALAFFSMHPNGTFDKHALHGGCPVIKGEKMVMTKYASALLKQLSCPISFSPSESLFLSWCRWIRDQCFGFC